MKQLNEIYGEVLSPMEVRFFATGKINLDAIVAQIMYLERKGYLDITKNALVIKKYPESEESFTRIIFNGLFYHTEEIELTKIPLVFAYAVKEAVRYLEFETYHVYSDKKRIKPIYEYGREILNADPSEFENVYALSKGKQYAKTHNIEIENYLRVSDAISKVLTPTLVPIGRKTAGGIGRGLAGAGGPMTTNADVENIHNIEWEYLINRK